MERKSPNDNDLLEARGNCLKPPAPFIAGGWLVEPELNSLRRGTVERHLEPKVMKVLLALAEHPNHVVSKDDLMTAVWPGTFVSDDVLTRCISMLRRATRDDPSRPQFIQTIPKVGYRLVAAIEEAPVEKEPTQRRLNPQPETSDVSPEEMVTAIPEIAHLPAATAVPEPASTSTRQVHTIWIAAAVTALCLLAITAFLILRSSRNGSRDVVLRTLPFTSQAGEQLQPAFSPDGGLLAYVGRSSDGSSQHLFLKRIGAEQTQQITDGPGQDFSPTWAPDGKQIAYLSQAPDGLGIFLLDLANHSSRRVFVPQEITHWEEGGLSWSPDGHSLVFPDHPGSNPSASIFLLDLATLQAHELTRPPDGWEGDLTPAFSPDGQRIAFTRASETAIRDLFWVASTGGEVHPLTHDRTYIDSLAWAADARSIIFSSNRGGKSALWRMSLKGREPERMPMGTEDAAQPAISRVGAVTSVAYTQGSAVWSIIEVAAGSDTEPRAIVSSTQQDSAPSLAPDGRRFAFQSQRSGFQEIWTANVDGTNLQQLTHQSGPLTGSPAWAHTRDQILFDSRVGGHSHIFAISAGGQAQQLTSGEFNDITPRWSNNDTTVYFRSNRGGRWQVWRMDMQSRQPEPVTTEDGIVPQPSADGKWIYYTRGGEDGLWRVPAGGGTETRVLPQPAAGYWGFWQAMPRGILYLDVSERALRLYDPTTGANSLVARLRRMPPQFAGLTASADGHRILLTDEAQAGRHITLTETGPAPQ
ncbi:DNA-binding protein with winged-HTH domain [Terriglobus roseus DSM 18391]|uniref:DNA-binding protein with winged-HTH domain n=1 Tax=Terriglobus roseus (strain DSM 18391 / NRRL B-41598 / KBS 63) TaxID=926566 RepID=I3ZCW7_TERRK|nr:winged helix-turn-helix domain-containing protein [Terriglobus roseus]AFL87085.1 DNA-binding protein with winged-HTH domain [Terriglobus roseus DSM 18391]